jgi:tetratricopeptide (TPR) repeat protein
MRRILLAATLAIVTAPPMAVTTGCKPSGGNLNNPAFAGTNSALEIHERLEALIDQQKDSKQDREDAYALVKQRTGTTPEDLFARAAIAGRLAENRGLQAMGLVTEAEDYARRCRAIEPDFREGAATRLLGTLYVLAPATLVKHGDSETGLELLEQEVQAHPDRLVSRLRLAEAYIALNDSDPSREHLCVAKQGQDRLAAADKRLLARLLQDVGALKCGSPETTSPPPDTTGDSQPGADKPGDDKPAKPAPPAISPM